MSQPEKLHLVAYQGDTFEFRMQFTDGDDEPLDISDWEDITAQVRRRSQDAIVAEIDVTVEEADVGIVLLSVPAEAMEALSGVYYWDLSRTVDDLPRTVVGGRFGVRPEITRVEAS